MDVPWHEITFSLVIRMSIITMTIRISEDSNEQTIPDLS